MTPASQILLSPALGWRAAAAEGLRFLPTALVMAAHPASLRPLNAAPGDLGGAASPRALAVGPDGAIYLLRASDGALLRFDPCAQTFLAVPCIGGAHGARRWRDPIALLVCPRGRLHVLDAGAGTISVFATQDWSQKGVLGPYAWRDGRLAPARRGAPDRWRPRAFVMSGGMLLTADAESRMLHRIDRLGRWRGAFGPATGLGRPEALAADSKGGVYVLDAEDGAVNVLDPAGKFLRRVASPEEIATAFAPKRVFIDLQDTLWIAGEQGGVSLHAGAGCAGAPGAKAEADAHLLGFSLDGKALYHRAGAGLAAAQAVRFVAAAQIITEALDSGAPDCQWDRLECDIDLPDGAALRLETMASNRLLSPAEVAQAPADLWRAHALRGLSGNWEASVLSGPGRYLWVRLALTSDGAATPTIRAIRVVWPRVTSARFVPAVLSEGPDPAFVSRFFSLFDRLHATVSRQLDALPALFDPASAPALPPGRHGADFLDWLAGWIGLALDRNWPVALRRALVAQAPALFRLRGAPEGLRRIVALYAGVEPKLVECFRLRRWMETNAGRLDAATLWGPEVLSRLQLDVHAVVGANRLNDGGDPVTDPFAAYAHRCAIYLPDRGFSAQERASLEAIIAAAAPAHVACELKLVRPRFVAGGGTILGVNTVLGRDARAATTEASLLGEDNRLAARASTIELGSGLRLGRDTRLS